MKNIKLAMFALAGILFGCQQAEMVDPTENAGKAMKTVTIKLILRRQSTLRQVL